LEATIGFSRAVRVERQVFVVDQGFLDPRWLVEIEADAIVCG
jgi:hypothetical protein